MPVLGRFEDWGFIAFLANTRHYFTADLTGLLEELTGDLAYSLDMLEIERTKQAAEAEVLLNAGIMESSH